MLWGFCFLAWLGPGQEGSMKLILVRKGGNLEAETQMIWSLASDLVPLACFLRCLASGCLYYLKLQCLPTCWFLNHNFASQFSADPIGLGLDRSGYAQGESSTET